VTIIERTKVATVCVNCGGTIRQGRECVRRDGRQEAVCLTCHEDLQDLVEARCSGFLIVRLTRRMFRRLLWQ
jgi:hypothetical protein